MVVTCLESPSVPPTSVTLHGRPSGSSADMYKMNLFAKMLWILSTSCYRVEFKRLWHCAEGLGSRDRRIDEAHQHTSSCWESNKEDFGDLTCVQVSPQDPYIHIPLYLCRHAPFTGPSVGSQHRWLINQAQETCPFSKKDIDFGKSESDTHTVTCSCEGSFIVVSFDTCFRLQKRLKKRSGRNKPIKNEKLQIRARLS